MTHARSESGGKDRIQGTAILIKKTFMSSIFLIDAKS